MDEQQLEEKRGVPLPVEWYVPENVQSRYATNMVIQAGQHEFIVSFFEAQLPLLLGSAEENQEHLARIEKVRAVCVGRVIIAADRLPEFIAVMQTTLDAYQASVSEQ